MNSPKISVIIPAYNVQNYIKRSITSVLNQSYQNLEIIVVNDGSTDFTEEYVNEMALNDNRIKLINKENEGVSKARNTGIKNATGDYIGFVDADDWITNDMYEKLMQSALNANADIAICDYFVTAGDKVKYIHKNKQKEIVFVTGEDNFLIDKIILMPPASWNKLYKREIFNNIEYPEGKIFEDLVVFSKLILKSNIISFVNEPLYYYYSNRLGSIMNTKDDNFQEQLITQHIEKYEELKNINRSYVDKVNYMRLHKVYFDIKRKRRKTFLNVNELLLKDKKLYDFSFKESLSMRLNKNIMLRPLYQIQLRVKTFFKK